MSTSIIDKANWFNFDRIEMAYSHYKNNVDDALLKVDNQLKLDLLMFIYLYQTSQTKWLSKCDFSVKLYLWYKTHRSNLYRSLFLKLQASIFKDAFNFLYKS